MVFYTQSIKRKKKENKDIEPTAKHTFVVVVFSYSTYHRLSTNLFMYCMFLSIFGAWIYVSCTAFAPIVSHLLLLNQHYTVGGGGCWLLGLLKVWEGVLSIVTLGCITEGDAPYLKSLLLLLSIDGTLFLGFHMNHVFLTQTAWQ